MAVIMVEGFDLYNGTGANTGYQTRWTPTDIGLTGTSLATGRFGGQCLSQTAGSNTDRRHTRTFTAASSFSCGFALRCSVMPAAAPSALVHFTSSTTFMVGLTITSTGAVVAGRYTSSSASTALGTSSAGVIAANTWHYVECEITISDTVGVFKVYVDGVQVLNLTSQDTRNGTPTTCDTIHIGQTNGTNNTVYSYDDIYVTDSATRLGERKVETIYPTSDVAQGFARSTGSTNYTLVDEATVNGDTDYVQGSTVGDVDTYGLGDLSNTPTTIDAVQVNAFALKTDAGSRSIALQVKSGATTSDGSNYALSASYGKFERLLLTDPNTSSAWTGSGVNALQGGPKVTV